MTPVSGPTAVMHHRKNCQSFRHYRKQQIVWELRNPAASNGGRDNRLGRRVAGQLLRPDLDRAGELVAMQ